MSWMQAAPRAASAPAVRRIAIAVVVLAACDVDIPPDRIPAKYSVDDFYESTRYGAGSFSPDGKKLLVSTNASGVLNAAAVSVDGAGAPVPLTHSTINAIDALSYFPRDERVLYASDEAGNELTHLYVRELDGRVTDLTPGAQVKARFIGWGGGDSLFWVTTNERDPRYFDLYAYRVAGYARTLLYRNTDGRDVGAVSRDGRVLALTRSRNTDDSDIWLHDLVKGTDELISEHRGSWRYDPADFSPDGTELMYRTNFRRDFIALESYDVASGRRDVVLARNWDVLSARFSRKGSLLTIVENNDARAVPMIFDVKIRRELPLGVTDDSLTYSGIRFSADDRTMAFLASNGSTPPDLYAGPVGGPFHRVASSTARKMVREDFVAPLRTRFKSYDLEELPGILYMPHTATVSHKVPGLVFVHDGPGGQSTIAYAPLLQYLVNHEYAVFAVNNRGSSGYGKKFHTLDDRRHGDIDLRDVMASKQVLIESGQVDSSKIGVIGGGYGGYLVLAALAFHPDTFQVGVDMFGVANWIRALKSFPPWMESERGPTLAEMGDPHTDSLRLFGVSPIYHTSHFWSPVVVLQGANDPRMPMAEADALVAANRRNKTPVEYLTFPDEGRALTKRDNEKKAAAAILAFLDKYLKTPYKRPAP